MNMPLESFAHARGPKNAPVTLVEFADFECPFCGAAYPVVKRLEETFGDRLRVAFYEFPLRTVHPYAELAAEAAEAAGAQNMFWEMHDTLFEHQQSLGPRDIDRYAKAIGIPDLGRFEQELGSHQYAGRIDRSIAFGESMDVEGTPAFYINGSPFEDEYSYSALAAAITRVAAASKAGTGLE